MTVAELIAQLQALPQGLSVVTADGDAYVEVGELKVRPGDQLRAPWIPGDLPHPEYLVIG